MTAAVANAAAFPPRGKQTSELFVAVARKAKVGKEDEPRGIMSTDRISGIFTSNGVSNADETGFARMGAENVVIGGRSAGGILALATRPRVRAW